MNSSCVINPSSQIDVNYFLHKAQKPTKNIKIIVFAAEMSHEIVCSPRQSADDTNSVYRSDLEGLYKLTDGSEESYRAVNQMYVAEVAQLMGRARSPETQKNIPAVAQNLVSGRLREQYRRAQQSPREEYPKPVQHLEDIGVRCTTPSLAQRVLSMIERML